MKLLRLFAALLFLSPMAMALNFYGVQSLNGLHTTQIFTAPVAGIYFLTGYLSLPQGSTTGNTGSSTVVATVSKNGVTQIYQGLAGASGFSVPQMTLVSGDLITVGLSSVSNTTISPDLVINAVTGQVYYGNAF